MLIFKSINQTSHFEVILGPLEKQCIPFIPKGPRPRPNKYGNGHHFRWTRLVTLIQEDVRLWVPSGQHQALLPKCE